MMETDEMIILIRKQQLRYRTRFAIRHNRTDVVCGTPGCTHHSTKFGNLSSEKLTGGLLTTDVLRSEEEAHHDETDSLHDVVDSLMGRCHKRFQGGYDRMRKTNPQI